MYNAVKFAHKFFALDRVISSAQSDVVIWLDADVVTHKPVSNDFLRDLQMESGWSYLGRWSLDQKNGGISYPECGFMIFNRSTNGFGYFWSLLRYYYRDHGIFTLREWHDSFCFECAYRQTILQYPTFGFDIASLGTVDIGDQNHVFISSVLGQYMDHRKGNKKSLSESPEFIRRNTR